MSARWQTWPSQGQRCRREGLTLRPRRRGARQWGSPCGATNLHGAGRCRAAARRDGRWAPGGRAGRRWVSACLTGCDAVTRATDVDDTAWCTHSSSGPCRLETIPKLHHARHGLPPASSAAWAYPRRDDLGGSSHVAWLDGWRPPGHRSKKRIGHKARSLQKPGQARWTMRGTTSD